MKSLQRDIGWLVTFNGLPGTSVYNSGPNYAWATVPAGATSGLITVTTPEISSKSGVVQFIALPPYN
jgi:hypothetical protein